MANGIVQFNNDNDLFTEMRLSQNEIDLPRHRPNLVDVDSDNELFIYVPLSGVKGLNWRPPDDFVPNFSFGLDWTYIKCS